MRKPTTMWAAQLVGPGRFADELACVSKPSRSVEDHVVVRLQIAGICGSDRPFFENAASDPPPPPGNPVHECVGCVVEAADTTLVGQRVVAIPYDDAGLSEYFLTAVDRLAPIGSDLPIELAGLIQPAATVIAAADRIPDFREKRVGILGLGPMGLLFARIARERGAATVHGIDRVDRHDAPMADSLDGVIAAGMVKGEFDVVIDAAGHDPSTVDWCISAAAQHGSVLTFGVQDVERFAIDFKRFFRASISMTANVTPSWTEYLPIAERWVREHSQALTPLVTHTFDFADAQRAYDTAFTNPPRGRGKVLLVPPSIGGRSVD